VTASFSGDFDRAAQLAQRNLADGSPRDCPCSQMWQENLQRGYCTQEKFDRQMRDLDEACGPSWAGYSLPSTLAGGGGPG